MNNSNPSPFTEAVPHLRSSWLAHSILDLKHALELLDVFLDILQEKIIRVSPKKINLLVITKEKPRDISFETIGQSKARKIRTPPEPLIHGANQKDCGSRGHEKTFNKEQSLCLCSSLFRKWTLKVYFYMKATKFSLQTQGIKIGPQALLPSYRPLRAD